MSAQQYPEPVVGLFILNKNDELFLMKSHKWKGKYVVPGGHIEVGETIEQAIIREAKEETALDVTMEKYLCLWEFIAEQGFHKSKHMLFLNYLVRTNSTDVTLNDEGQEYIWVPIKDALKIPMEKYTKLTVVKYLVT